LRRSYTTIYVNVGQGRTSILDIDTVVPLFFNEHSFQQKPIALWRNSKIHIKFRWAVVDFDM